MDTHQLDQEKFNVMKELTEIHANLSLARSELLTLKADTEKYMVVREQEAQERVLRVLKESREALVETSTNHRELIVFNNELQAYANELHGLTIDITTLFQDFNTRMREAEKELEESREIVVETLLKIKVERVQVKEDRKLLALERKKTEEGKVLLADRRAALERAWDELDRLKDNYKKA